MKQTRIEWISIYVKRSDVQKANTLLKQNNIECCIKKWWNLGFPCVCSTCEELNEDDEKSRDGSCCKDCENCCLF